MKSIKEFSNYKNISFKKPNDTATILDIESSVIVKKYYTCFDKVRFRVFGTMFGLDYLSLLRKEAKYVLNCFEEEIKNDEKKKNFTDIDDLIYFVDPVEADFSSSGD